MTPIDTLIAKDRERQLKIAVVGDAMTDIYVHGHLDVGQEGCPKFVEDYRVKALGGAANAASQLDSWNACTILYSNYHSIEPIKTRFLVDGKHIFRHDNDEVDCETVMEECRKAEMKSLWNHPPDAVLISDYCKGFLTSVMIREIIKVCNERGIPVVADAKKPPHVYEGAIVQCNSAYLQKHLGANTYQDARDWPGFRDKVVVTHGAGPPLVGRKIINAGHPNHRIVNHIGAGDCFAAHLTLALAHGLGLEDAAAIAHAAGRVYVQHPHNRPPFPHEIRRDLDPVGGKVVKYADLKLLGKSNAGRVVFTNGVFAVPHAGHSFLMTWAKQQGDVLVVGVNDDASAGRLRGFALPLAERVAMLAGMESVDWVVPFSGDEPLDVIEALKPAVLVKGHDYTGCRVPGDELVKDVRFAPEGPFPQRHASGLVREIRQA